MKLRNFLSLIFGTLALASLSVAQTSVSAPPAAPAASSQQATTASINQGENAQKAKALLQQAIQALGGPAFLNLQDMQEDGRTYGYDHGRPAGGGVQFWLFWQWPENMRIELTKQRDVAYIYNADKGYEKTYRGVRALDAKELQDYLALRELAPVRILRQRFNAPGTALFYDGRTFAGNSPADKVSLMDSNNQSVSIFLDSQTHLPVKTSVNLRDPETRDRITYEEVYANYHLVQGIETPYVITRSKNGDTIAQRFINHISYNNHLADSLFQVTVTYNPPVFH